MNGFLQNRNDLELLVQEYQPIILALQEIHRVSETTMDSTIGRKYKWHKTAGTSLYHSVAIGVLADIPAVRLNITTDLPIVGVRLDLPIAVSALSVYLPNGKLPNLRERLQDALDQIPGPIIMLGDINGHHQSWGDKKTDARGCCVMDLACGNDLVVLNDGSPTFFRGTTETAIDVTLASSEIGHKLLWHVKEDPHSSDHSPIIVTLTNSTQPETTRRPRWLFEQADWAGFQELVEKELDQYASPSIEDITASIIKAASETIPRTSPNPGRRALHWWNDTTKAAVKHRRKKLRTFKKIKNKLPPDHPNTVQAKEEYQKARNACRQTIREEKEKSWTKFLDSINDQQSSAELWRRVNCLRGKRRVKGMCLTVDNVPTRDPQIIAEALGEYFQELSSMGKYPEAFRRKHHCSHSAISNFEIAPDCGQPFNTPFQMAELEFALRRAKGKSAGPDELAYPLLKNLPPSGKQGLLRAINSIWTSGTLPADWRHSLVVPIPKGSGPANSTSSYRPIALTSCASKVMERMANRRLVEYLESNGLLDDRQHAFRSGRGTGTFLAALGQILDDALSKGDHAELVSLDLAKAYNRAWTPGILEKLARWGITGNLLRYLKGFLTERTFQVTVGNSRSNIQSEETGVPQGSVIAVTLFLVAMSGVFEVLPGGVFLVVYADDITLVVTGAHPKAIRRKAQAAATAVGKWASTTGFEISAAKSTRIHICGINHRPPRKPIKLNGETIPLKRSLRIMGITLDRHLTLKNHLIGVKHSCKDRLNLLRSISAKRTCSDRATCVRVADAIIGSRLPACR